METLFNKRRFLAALTAALLISAALITGCMNEFDGQNKPDDNVIIPEGKGLVKFNLADNSARTILPTIPDLSTLKYDIEIVGRAGASNASVTKETLANAQKPIVLGVGTYDITITAWNAAGTEEVAGWTSPTAGVSVTTGNSTTVEANLIGWTSSGSGTFKYYITLPALPVKAGGNWDITTPPSAYTVSKLEIFDTSGDIIENQSDYPGYTAIGTNGVITLLPGSTNTDTLTIWSGYYIVKITLQATNCQDRVFSSALHIYKATETTWGTATVPFTVPALNQGKFTVHFDLNEKTADDPSSAFNTGATAGKDTQLITNIDVATDPGAPANTAFIFGGWFKNTAGTGDAWDFDNLVFKDTTLYAKWTAKPSQGATIAITFTVSDASIVASKDPDDYSGSITYDAINDGDVALVFELKGGTFTDIKWDLDGIVIAGATGSILTIDDGFPALNRLVSGTHVLNVKGERNNQAYSAYVTFVVTVTP